MQEPIKVIAENRAMVFPLSTGPQMSARNPGAFKSRALGNVPVKNNRPVSKVAKLFAKAQRKLIAEYEVNNM
jgi:hypothetical protein